MWHSAVQKLYDLIDTGEVDQFVAGSNREFEPITKIASKSCNCPTSLLSIIRPNIDALDVDDALTCERIGLDACFLGHVARAQAAIIVPDATRDFRFRDNLLVRSYPRIRFYAGVPVLGPDGAVIAVLCVIDYVPRHGLSAGELETLGDLARLASDRLCLAAERDARRLRRPDTDDAGRAVLLVDGNAGFLNWNTAAERLLGTFADDLWQAGARHHLPDWDRLVAGAAEADRAAPSREARLRVIPLVLGDGRRTLAVGTVTRDTAFREPRYRVVLQSCEEGD